MLQNWEIAKGEKGRGIDLILYTKDLSDKEILDAIKNIEPFEIDREQ
jgi:hypothetical protein